MPFDFEDSAHFSACLSGCEGRVLIDSGAFSVFVNQKYLIANGIATFEGTPVKVRVADGSLAITNLRCDFVLDLGQHRSRVRAYVLPDLGSDDTAALLGRSWMKQAGCMVGYEGPRLRACMHTLKRGTVSIDSDRIPSVPHSSLELVTYCLARVADASTTPGLLSIKKLRKLLRRTRDLNAFEVTVRSLDEDDDRLIEILEAARADLHTASRNGRAMGGQDGWLMCMFCEALSGRGPQTSLSTGSTVNRFLARSTGSMVNRFLARSTGSTVNRFLARSTGSTVNRFLARSTGSTARSPTELALGRPNDAEET
eukprot:gene10360-8299_t